MVTAGVTKLAAAETLKLSTPTCEHRVQHVLLCQTHFFNQCWWWAVSVHCVLLSSSTPYIFYLKCSCGGDGNWSINVKRVCDLEGPLKMTNLRSHELRSERCRAREPGREKMKTKEDCRPICVKVRARVMNTLAIWSSRCLLPCSCL